MAVLPFLDMRRLCPFYVQICETLPASLLAPAPYPGTRAGVREWWLLVYPCGIYLIWKILPLSVLCRIPLAAVINSEKCKPKKCRQECKKGCPVVRMGKLCIEVTPKDKIAFISEILCIGCGICVKKCPFEVRALQRNAHSCRSCRYREHCVRARC